MSSYHQPQSTLKLPNFAEYHAPALELIDLLLDKAKARLRAGNYPEDEAMVWSMDWRAEMQSLFKRGMHFIDQIEASLLKCEAIGYEARGTYVMRLKG